MIFGPDQIGEFRRRRLTGVRVCFCAVLLIEMAGFGGVSLSQVHYNPKVPMKGPTPSTASSGSGGSMGDLTPDPGVNLLPDPNRKLYAALNQLRHKEMASETARLVQLAHELKAEADKGGREVLSAESIQKTQQIEKLARSVRVKMTASVGPY